MDKYNESNRLRQLLFAVIATMVFVLTASSVAVAQGKYKIGDRVECDATQMGTFKKGTIVPFPKSEADQSGRLYYVKLDGSNITEGYVCMATHMRPLVEAASSKPENEADNQAQNQPNTSNQTGNQSSANEAQATFKPGDRVQCDAAQIGAWKAGTVMHYLQTDRYRDANGGYFRVRIDAPNKYAFDPGGQVCMAKFMRPFKDGHKEKSSGMKYSVGDRIEAQSYAGNWFPAKITALAGDFYTVRYDNYDSTHDETVDAVRLRTPGKKTDVDKTDKDKTDLPIKMAGGIPAIPGTAWKMDFGIKGANVQRILFCKSGRWEVVSSQLLNGGAASLMGTYTVSGSTIALKADGKTTSYQMSLNGGVLQLTGGKQNMRLYEPVPTQCK